MWLKNNRMFYSHLLMLSTHPIIYDGSHSHRLTILHFFRHGTRNPCSNNTLDRLSSTNFKECFCTKQIFSTWITHHWSSILKTVIRMCKPIKLQGRVETNDAAFPYTGWLAEISPFFGPTVWGEEKNFFFHILIHDHKHLDLSCTRWNWATRHYFVNAKKNKHVFLSFFFSTSGWYFGLHSIDHNYFINDCRYEKNSWINSLEEGQQVSSKWLYIISDFGMEIFIQSKKNQNNDRVSLFRVQIVQKIKIWASHFTIHLETYKSE